MTYRALIKFTLFVIIFLSSSIALAVEISSLKACGFDVTDKDYIEIHKVELINEQIQIEGAISDEGILGKVIISLDAGVSWQDAKGLSPFKFSFTPQEATEYSILIKALDKAADSLVSRVVVVKYFSVDLRELFYSIFERLRVSYIDERLNDFLAFFDSEEYPNFDTFKQNMQDAFDDTSNFNLNISIRSIDLQREGDLSIIRVDWDKTFESNSTQSGKSNEIHFKKKGADWKVVFLEDDTIFVIGTGTMRATY